MSRSDQIFQEHREAIFRRTDRMFALLMVLQYFAGILAVLIISPRTWIGEAGSTHIHVWAAVVLGGVLLSVPIALAILIPGKTVTRYVIAIAQILDSALLIHLTGGRIETHFHVFGSLAFLGFYRDWKVLITASAVVAADHYFRGVYWPQSVFGVLSASPWRWLEHTGWVIFEDIFILVACHQSIREMREIAERRSTIEQVAQERERDIEELQEARSQLKQALSAKDAFISICGHELKTPLTSMSLQTQLTQRALAKGTASLLSPERIGKLMDQSDSQIKRLLRLVQDMLDQSRIQAGKLEFSPEPVDLSELVREVIERCQPQADAAGCPLFLEEAPPLAGHWDRFRIEQVVTNLVTNAVKYGDGKPIEISLERSGTHAKIRVRDHGIGIRHEDQTKIFEQFRRVDDTHHIAGLGLGLYISKSIVERHGGEILVESAVHQGSTFIVHLPLDSSAALRQPVRAPA
jgi:signal transduction histidine kinase